MKQYDCFKAQQELFLLCLKVEAFCSLSCPFLHVLCFALCSVLSFWEIHIFRIANYGSDQLVSQHSWSNFLNKKTGQKRALLPPWDTWSWTHDRFLGEAEDRASVCTVGWGCWGCVHDWIFDNRMTSVIRRQTSS